MPCTREPAQTRCANRVESATNPDPRLIIVGSRSPIRAREKGSPREYRQDRIAALQEFNVKFQLRHIETSDDLFLNLQCFPNQSSTLARVILSILS
jgi:hypothetical protein